MARNKTSWAGPSPKSYSEGLILLVTTVSKLEDDMFKDHSKIPNAQAKSFAANELAIAFSLPRDSSERGGPNIHGAVLVTLW